MLKLTNITKIYPNKFEAIKPPGISLQADNNEFVAIVGSSGCGKSTLLRIIAGLENVTSGEIYYNDILINSLSPAQRGVSMVFQNYALYPHMTCYNNMMYGLKNYKIPKQEAKDRITKVAEMLGITQLLGSKPANLSGGQRQRVAMGRAIVKKPKIFLFDEPLSNLDSQLRSHMRVEIKKLHRELDVTSLYVTHDQVEAMTLADKLVVLNQGRVEQIGSPLEVYNNPKNVFVAKFVGSPSINLIEVNHPILQNQSHLLPPNTATVGIRASNILYIKPQTPHLTLANLGVEEVEVLGEEVLYHYQYQGNPKLLLVVKNKVAKDDNIKQDSLYLPLSSLICFDSNKQNLSYAKN